MEQDDYHSLAEAAVGRGSVSMQPFDYHRARPVEIESRAQQLLRLAEEAVDRQAVTDRAFDPATASWDGVAAAELRAAPEPIRKQAEQVASRLSWAAVPLRYWADQVRRFNSKVDALLVRLAGVPGEVERQVAAVFGEVRATLDDEVYVQREVIRHRLISDLRREWEEAYETHIREGANTAAGMLTRGPTYEYLQLTRKRGLLPVGGLVDFLAVDWDRTAALGEAQRIAGMLLEPSAPLPAPDELDRLAALLERYAQDEEFAYALLTALGPRGLLELTGQVATLSVDDGGEVALAETLGAIQAGLAVALATATRRRGTGGDEAGALYQPGEFELPPEWVTGLLAAGRQKIPVGAGSTAGLEPYGYQLLGVLLGYGTYDTHFLAVVGADLVDFEYEQGTSAFWADARRTDARLNWIDGPGEVDPPAGFDPMIGLVKALIVNPEAGRYLFTSATPDEPISTGLRRLDYLLTDRDWPIDTVVGAAHLTTGDAHTGVRLFGQALERITTVDADERAYRIVEGIIRAVGTDESVMGFPNDPSGRGRGVDGKTVAYPGTDVVHKVLRPYLGRIASHYIEDLHWRVEGNWGRSAWLSAGEMRLTGVDEQHLKYFLAELGKDARARDEVFAAELAYADRLYRTVFDGWDGSDSEVVNYANGQVTRPLSILLDALDVGAQEMIKRGYAQADEAHNRAVAQRLFWLRAPGIVVADALPAGGNAFNSVYGTVLDFVEQSYQRDSSGLVAYEVNDLQDATAKAIEDMIDIAIYEEFTSRYTPDEVLARIPDRMADVVGVLVRPGQSPSGDAFVPPEDWTDAHWDAWEALKAELDMRFIDEAQESARTYRDTHFRQTYGQ